MRKEGQETSRVLPNDSTYFSNFDRTQFSTSKSRQQTIQDLQPRIKIHAILKTPTTMQLDKSTTCSSTKFQMHSSRNQSEAKSIKGVHGLLQFQSLEQLQRKSKWQNLVSITRKKFSLEPYIYTHDLRSLLNLPEQKIDREFFGRRKRSHQPETKNSPFTIKETLLDQRAQKKQYNFNMKVSLKNPFHNAKGSSLVPQVAATIIKNYQAQIKSNKRLFQRLDEMAHPHKYIIKEREEKQNIGEENMKIYESNLRFSDKTILRQELAKVHDNVYLKKKLEDKDLKKNYQKLGMVSTWNQYVNDIMKEKKKVLLKLNTAINQDQRNYILKLFRNQYDPQNNEYEQDQFLQEYFDSEMYDFVCSVY